MAWGKMVSCREADVFFLKNEKVNHMFQAFSRYFFNTYTMYTVYLYIYSILQCVCYMFNMCLHLISGEDVRQSCAAEGVDSPCAGLAW